MRQELFPLLEKLAYEDELVQQYLPERRDIPRSKGIHKGFVYTLVYHLNPQILQLIDDLARKSMVKAPLMPTIVHSSTSATTCHESKQAQL